MTPGISFAPGSPVISKPVLNVPGYPPELAITQALAPGFQARLRQFGQRRCVGEARGVGLIGALELVADKASRQPFAPALKAGPRLAQLAQEQGLIVRAMGDTVALCPPLIISAAELDTLFARLDQAFDLFEASLPT